MNCYHCGAKYAPDAKFCPKCGAAMTFTEELLAAGRQNDEKALEALYYLTYNNVYHTLKSMIRDEDTVLDLVQDTYVKAFRSLEQLDKAENFRAWVKRIAANKAKDYIKKAKPMLFLRYQHIFCFNASHASVHLTQPLAVHITKRALRNSHHNPLAHKDLLYLFSASTV